MVRQDQHVFCEKSGSGRLPQRKSLGQLPCMRALAHLLRGHLDHHRAKPVQDAGAKKNFQSRQGYLNRT